MKRRNIVKRSAILIVLGFTTLFGFQANSQTVNTFIESIEAKHPAPDTTPEKYEGSQTVKGVDECLRCGVQPKVFKGEGDSTL